VNSNIKGIQIIPQGGAVTFPLDSEFPQEYYLEGITYNGTDTFTIVTPGLYSLTCVLSLDTGERDNTFYIELNGYAVAGTANMGTDGQIVLTRVGFVDAGTNVRIVNGSFHDITIANASVNPSSTGHLSLFRFADLGVGEIT